MYKEFNREAYNLRYAGCWAPYLSLKDGKVQQFYAQSIGNDNKAMILMDTEGNEIKTTLNEWHPLYARMEAGYYPVSFIKHQDLFYGVTPNIRYLCVRRRMVKSFKQAFNSDDYMLFAPGVTYASINAAVPVFVHNNKVSRPSPEIDIERAINEEGLIDEFFYLTKDGIYYLDQLIGVRSKDKLIVKRNYHHEVSECLSSTRIVVSTF